jgi:hypothetical protein
MRFIDDKTEELIIKGRINNKEKKIYDYKRF